MKQSEAAKAPEGKLLAQIEKTFGSVEALKEKLTALALGQFGSGWAWLNANAGGEELWEGCRLRKFRGNVVSRKSSE